MLFEVTSRCNSRCRTCFYWERVNTSAKELTLEEINKIAKSFGRIFHLSISGGEPFLRNDLDQICYIFYKFNRARSIDIPTNCLLPEQIESVTKRILTLCNEANISIDLSIDGVGKTHDFIRGVEGNFDKVNETCRRLWKLKANYKNLWLKTNVTFSGYNQDHIGTLLKHINDKMKIKDIYIYPAWGQPIDSKVKDFSYDKYVDAMRLWEKERELSNQSLFARAIFAIRKAVAKEALDIIQKQKLNYPCMAIKKVIVINEEGDVYPCPILKKKLGSLRDNDYNIRKIIYSEKRYDVEKKYKINSGCFCHWDCAIFNNIIYNWKNFPRLIKTVIFGLLGKD